MLRTMRGIAIAVGLGLIGCSSNKAAVDPDAGHGSGSGSGVDGNPVDSGLFDGPPITPDAPDVARPLYALSGASLYQIDLLAMTSTLVAPITSGGTPVQSLDGLGFDGANLIGLDHGSTSLLVIDPTTAAIIATKTLGMPGLLGGLTVIPANEVGNAQPMFLAASGDKLYRITPVSGAVTELGTFSGGATFSSDLAWVHGHGLYVTLHVMANGGGTDGTDLVQIDPANASTIADLRGGYNNINGLSGYRGHLWGVSQGGNVYAIDPASGMLMQKLTGGPPYTEAAQ